MNIGGGTGEGENLDGIKKDDKQTCLYYLKSYNQILMINVASKSKWSTTFGIAALMLDYNKIWIKLQNTIAVDKNLKKNIDTYNRQKGI